MPRYRKKSVIIDAFQMTEERSRDNSEWPSWLHEAWNKEPGAAGSLYLASAARPRSFLIATLEGAHHVTWGDWIIRGVQGELYPCKPDIFEATYEAVEEENDE